MESMLTLCSMCSGDESGFLNWVREIEPILAMIISFFALLASFGAIYLGYRQARYSVLPIAQINQKKFVHQISISLSNVGQGPLKISKLRVTDGSNVKEGIFQHMPLRPKSILWNSYRRSSDKHVIAPGNSITLLKLSIKKEKELKENLDFFKRVKDQLGKLTISVEYKDIYNRTFHEEKRLSLFMPKDDRTEDV